MKAPKRPSKLPVLNFTPFSDLVAIYVIDNKKSAGGVIYPDGARTEEAAYSIVLGVGPDVKTCKAGDMIVTAADILAKFIPDVDAKTAEGNSMRILLLEEKALIGGVVNEQVLEVSS